MMFGMVLANNQSAVGMVKHEDLSGRTELGLHLFRFLLWSPFSQVLVEPKKALDIPIQHPRFSDTSAIASGTYVY